MLPPNENGQPGGSGGTPQGVVNLNQQHFNSSQQYHQKYYQNIK